MVVEAQEVQLSETIFDGLALQVTEALQGKLATEYVALPEQSTSLPVMDNEGVVTLMVLVLVLYVFPPAATVALILFKEEPQFGVSVILFAVPVETVAGAGLPL